MRILGDFDVAEEIVQDALLVALERWPVDGIPERPGAWLLTVARRRALNQLSRDARYHEKLAQLEQPILQVRSTCQCKRGAGMIESGGQSVLLEAMHYLASVNEHMLYMPFRVSGAC